MANVLNTDKQIAVIGDAYRVQISSDALRAYVDAVEMNFGADVDFAQIIKTYVTDHSVEPERRLSAPEIVVTEKKPVSGFPDLRLASTSHVERLNGTTRLHMRRLTRLTYAFSKKLENFQKLSGSGRSAFRLLQFREASQYASRYSSDGSRNLARFLECRASD